VKDKITSFYKAIIILTFISAVARTLLFGSCFMHSLLISLLFSMFLISWLIAGELQTIIWWGIKE
jgi:hypothetical protein